MGKYIVVYSDDAQAQLKAIKKAGDRAVMAKIQRLVIELSEHPAIGTGKPEQLKHELSGLWFRRIDKKNRIVYEIEEEQMFVHIVRLVGHYNDK